MVGSATRDALLSYVQLFGTTASTCVDPCAVRAAIQCAQVSAQPALRLPLRCVRARVVWAADEPAGALLHIEHPTLRGAQGLLRPAVMLQAAACQTGC